ncbi:MAG TPA: response regulator [Candidatus Methylomirabilis sp.]|nr:response regulator [Candidatus Methylomirabilis sp.]
MPESPPDGGAATLPPQILVVDDLAQNRELLQAHLEAAGYRVLLAGSGQEALAAVVTGRPDLILLDVMMPGPDGYEVCRRLKTDPTTAFIPIVLLTALQEVEYRIRGNEAGADDFLSKPFNPLELLTRVRSLLRVKALHDQVTAHTRRLEEMVAERTAALERALTDLREMDRLKSEFLTNVSHELRTPLTPIMGYLPAILKGEFGSLSQPQRQALELITDSVQRLHRLIEDLLTFMQWESGEAILHLEPVSVQVVLDAASAKAGAAAEGKGVTLVRDVPPHLPRIRADASALSNALGHLLENAVKFTPQGGQVVLTARWVGGGSGNQAPGGSGGEPMPPVAGVPDGHRHQAAVEIAVRDTGIGIKPEAIPRIFDRFYQADSSATRRHGGTGLGLAIVKRILDAHGATITVESLPGHGATFSLRLPEAP